METPDSHEIETLSDEDIVSLVRDDAEYFGYLIDRYEAKLGRYLVRLGVRTPEDRQDVLQDTFIKVYKNINAFDTRLSFSSWIYRITHNEAVSWFRKHSVRPEAHVVGESDTILALMDGGQTDQEVQFDQTINAQQLEEALQQLEKKYCDVLILRYFEHKEYDEISDILKIPIGSVGTLLHRGKKRLAEHINPDTIHV